MNPISRFFFFLISVSAALGLNAQAVHASQGDLYVGGLSNGVLKFDSAGARSTYVTRPYADAIAFDAQGNLFVADTQNHVIVKIDPNKTKTIFAVEQPGETFVPAALAFDSAGNLFVSDAASGRIYKFTPSGARSVFASGISAPSGLVFDQQGNLFVSEANTGAILRFTPAGTPTTYATGFRLPTGLAFDSAGALYVVDVGSGSIIKLTSPSSRTQVTFGLSSPRFIAFDGSGNLFVSNLGASEIRKIDPNGTSTIFASGVAASGLAFGPGGGTLANISTRLFVGTDDNVGIAGFIISGSQPKKVIIRGLGPSLAINGRLENPTLKLFNSSQQVLVSNDNWVDAPNKQEIIDSTVPPSNPLESAIVTTLAPGRYTAIIEGVGRTSGVGQVEVYDLNLGSDSKFVNISTRGFVQTGDRVMIGGIIVVGPGSQKVIVRAIGPSLPVAGKLQDPTLQLFDGNGVPIAFNDNWRSDQEAAIIATTVPPPSNAESAIVRILMPGEYTAIVRGKNDTVGVALVEVFALD